MNNLPNTPSSLFKLIITTLAAYPIILAQTFFLVALSSIGHLIIPYLYLQNPTFGLVATVGFVLLTWFLYTAIICKAKIATIGGNMSLHSDFRIARQRFLAVLGSNIIFFAIGLFTGLIIFALNLLFSLVDLHPVYLTLSVIISLVIFVYLYFAIPEIALEHAAIIKSFEKSVQLVRHNWWRSFLVLAFFGAVIFGFEALGVLFTGKNRMMLFTGYHFAMQLFFYPLIISATLVLLNDLKLRQERA